MSSLELTKMCLHAAFSVGLRHVGYPGHRGQAGAWEGLQAVPVAECVLLGARACWRGLQKGGCWLFRPDTLGRHCAMRYPTQSPLDQGCLVWHVFTNLGPLPWWLLCRSSSSPSPLAHAGTPWRDDKHRRESLACWSAPDNDQNRADSSSSSGQVSMYACLVSVGGACRERAIFIRMRRAPCSCRLWCRGETPAAHMC